MQKIAIVGAMLLLAACAAPNPAPLPPSGPIPAADRYAFTKLDQKTCPTEARNFADWVERYRAFWENKLDGLDRYLSELHGKDRKRRPRKR